MSRVRIGERGRFGGVFQSGVQSHFGDAGTKSEPRHKNCVRCGVGVFNVLDGGHRVFGTAEIK